MLRFIKKKRITVYDKIDYATKKNVIEEFIVFRQGPPLKDGKPQSFNDFCHQVGANVGKKWSTIKEICLNYAKKPAILTQLEILCSNQKGISMWTYHSTRLKADL